MNSIWEGTTDVFATDALRALKGHSGGQALSALNRWILKAVSSAKIVDPPMEHAKGSLIQRWGTWMGSLSGMNSEELLPLARDMLFQISDVIISFLLFVNGQSESSPASTEVLFRFL